MLRVTCFANRNDLCKLYLALQTVVGAFKCSGAGWKQEPCSRTRKPASCSSSFATQAVGNVTIHKRKDLALSVSSFLISLSLKGKTCVLLPEEDVRITVIQVNLSLSGTSPNRGFS